MAMNKQERKIKSLLGGSQRSKIQRQLLLLLLLSTALPVAVVGTYGSTIFTKVTSQSLLEDFEEESVTQANVITTFFKSVKKDARFLNQSYQVKGFVEADNRNSSVDGLSADEWKTQVTGNIAALMEAHPEYRKIKYLDKNGVELIRVQRGEEENSPIEIVTASELKDLSDEEHISQVLDLEAGDVFVTEFSISHSHSHADELNHADEVSEEEALGGGAHVASPVFDAAGNRHGLIVADVSSQRVVDILEEVEEEEVDDNSEETLFLVDAKGYYIHHPDESKLWGNELDHGSNLQKDFAEKAVEELLAGDEGVVQSGSTLIAYAKVDPDLDHEAEHFYIAETLPRESVYGPIAKFRNVALLVALSAVMVAMPLGILRGRQLIGLIERLINGISTSSQQIFSTVSEQERIASQQAASVSETSTTMEELEASSRQSAEQAMAAVDAAKTALNRAEVGSQAVDETLAGMFTLDQKVNAIAQQIVNLSGQAGEIGSISQMVSDFANQTNMLALNSSVEAVRAGEHGRGFAVVANEIRKLSEQSQRSSDKINGLVAEIQRLINKTVMVTEEGTKTAKSGVKVAKLTEQAFADIKQSIDAVVLNNQQVSLTQKQQVNAIRQVVTAMETIDRSSKESATGLSQTRSGTEQLNETARSLRDMM